MALSGSSSSGSSLLGGVATAAYPVWQGYILLFFMIFMTLSLELARLSLVVLVDPVRQSLGIGDVDVSLLLGILASVPFVAMSLIGGYLSDRVSRKLLLAVAALMWISGALICATAPNFTTLAIGRFMIGLGAGMKLPIAMTWINDAFPPARRGRAVGAFFVVLGTGPSLAIMLAGAVQGSVQSGLLSGLSTSLAGGDSWRVTIGLMALPSILLLFVLPTLTDRREAVTASTQGESKSLWGVSVGLFLLIIVAAALISMVDGAILAWMSTILIREFGFETARAGFIFGIASMVAGFAGPLIGGALGDVLFNRYGPAGRVYLAGGAALMILPAVACYLLNMPIMLIAALVLSGICIVSALSLSYVTIQAVLPPTARGLGTGIMNAVLALIGSAGPTLVALVAAPRKEAPSTLIQAIVTVAASAAVLAAISYLVCAFQLRRARLLDTHRI